MTIHEEADDVFARLGLTPLQLEVKLAQAYDELDHTLGILAKNTQKRLDLVKALEEVSARLPR